MAFSLNTNNLVGSKMREEMYLRHLREVQKISNREADTLKKQLNYYRSISELHRNNKEKAYRRKLEEINKSIEAKNQKIQQKISKIGSDEQLKQASRTLLATMSSSNNKNYIGKNEDTEAQSLKSPIKNDYMKTLHYRYRKRQQEQIQEENTKIFKAIETQKSMLLPLIGKSRCISQLNKSAHIRHTESDKKKKIEAQADSESPSDPRGQHF